MNYSLDIKDGVQDDLREISNSQRILVYKQLNKILKSPELGKLLGNKSGYDLSGCRKMYADSKRIRIVYKIIEDKIIIEVVAVGKRNNMEVYKKASKRL
jgi:mRNA interferase RelE/StbE